MIYYLSLGERLSQLYLHHYIILLVLMIIKVYLFGRALNNSLDQMADSAQQQHEILNNYSRELSQLPVNISKALNSAISSLVNQFVASWLNIIVIFGKVIKNLLLFYLEIFLGTITCLVTAAVNGTVNFALDSSESLIKGVNSTIVGLTNTIDDGLNGLSSVINTLISSLDKVKSLFTGKTDNGEKYTNMVNISVKALRNVSIPSSVLDDIKNFKKKVPDFLDINNDTNLLIAKPFELLAKELQNSTSFHNISTDSFPQMPRAQVGNFLESSQALLDLIDRTSAAVNKIANIIVICLCGMILFGLIFLALCEFNKYQRHINFANTVKEESMKDVLINYRTNNFMALHRLNLVMSRMSDAKRNVILWLINYITSSFAIWVLIISFVGFISILLQYILLRLLQKLNFQLAPSLVAGSRANNYIKDVNLFLTKRENTMNKEVFGHIKSASSSVNSTLNTFMSNVNHTISILFDSTPFKGPINTVIYCTFGRKIATIERGLTWINDNVEVKLPRISKQLQNDINDLQNFSLEVKLAEYAQKAADKVIVYYQKTLLIELWICCGLFGLWLLQILIGCIILAFKNYYTDDIVISGPKPLTEDEKKQYGYPLTIPLLKEPSSMYTSDSQWSGIKS